MTIRIDDLVKKDYQREFEIAGETKTVNFNDHTVELISSASNDMATKLQTYLTNLEGQESDDQVSFEGIKKVTSEAIANFKETRIKFYDELFGDGFGLKMYKYYGESTAALSKIFDIIVQEMDKINTTKTNKKRNHYVKKNKRG